MFNMTKRYKSTFLLFIMLIINAMISSGVRAATIMVTSPHDLEVDHSSCTLRGAIKTINNRSIVSGCSVSGAFGVQDTIQFDESLAGQTIALTGAEISITQNLVLKGPNSARMQLENRVTLDRPESNQRLLKAAFGVTSLTLSDLVFKNGRGNIAGGAIRVMDGTVLIQYCEFNNNTTNGTGGAIDASGLVMIQNSHFNNNSAAQGGGAISTAGNIIVTESAFIQNKAIGGGEGGALQSWGNISVDQSTFTQNIATADFGGAISARNSGVISVSNSVFNQNKAYGYGGALHTFGDVDVSNSTFYQNTVIPKSIDQDAGGAIRAKSITGYHLTLIDNTATDGAALYSWTSNIQLVNSLIVGQGGACDGNSLIRLASLYNLIWDSLNHQADDSCGDQLTTTANPQVGALQDNGGTTHTMALPANSVAINAGDIGALLTYPNDQRGVVRDEAPDLGAFEHPVFALDPVLLAEATYRQPYYQLLSTSVGQAPFTFAIKSGALPQGLVLNQTTGQISGTPSVDLSSDTHYSFAIKVLDAHMQTDERDYIILVKAWKTFTALLPDAIVLTIYAPPACILSSTSHSHESFTLAHQQADLIVFPYDFVSFKLEDCDIIGFTAKVMLTYPLSILSSNTDKTLWHYNRVNPQWVNINTVANSHLLVNGNIFTYYITDGGVFDEDGVADATLIDPVGLAISPRASSSAAVPLSSIFSLIMLPIIICILNFLMSKGQRRRKI